jgi:hypothetical protein
MQITCDLQITNIAKLGVRVSAVKLLRPWRVKVRNQVYMVEGRGGPYSSQTIIPQGAIGHAEPVTGRLGKPLRLDLALFDQFNNRYVIRKLFAEYVRPPPPK